MTDTPSPPDSARTVQANLVALGPGRTIGRYEIVGLLGQGSFGITYRARDTQLGREVAIKEYLPSSLAVRQDGSTVLPRSTEVADDFAWGRERFVAEGRTLASLHEAPAIVRVHDFLETNGTAYIVMELLRGQTLERRIRQSSRLSPVEIDAILWPLLDGLEQVHEAGFLHRDIKPANILLNAAGKPTLIDFGASRAAMASRTTAMTAIFTPGYAAAEQFTSAKQGPWTDIYGLSATLYHAIAGKVLPSAFDRMLDDTFEPLSGLQPAGFARGLLAGIDSGLAVRSAERPQSIAQWRPMLQGMSAGGDATAVAVKPVAPPAPSPAPAPAASPRTRLALYAGLAVAVLALAGGGYFLLAPKPAPQVAGLQDLKVEDLERVLAERRKADAAAAEKKRLEEEAQRKAEADAASKRAADAELVLAQQQRQKAEEELAKLKADIEARRQAEAGQQAQSDAATASAAAKRAAEEAAQRKAEAEMAALRQAEEDAQKKAEAEAASKKQADDELAKAQADRLKAEAEASARRRAEEETAAKQKAEATAKQKAEIEARQKAEADARAKAEAEAVEAKAKADAEAKLKAEAAAAAADKKIAEATEGALRLAMTDRQRLQVALTSLGFDTRGSDGAFGPRSREMIGNWQKARNQPVTGFLTGPQQQALLKEAAAAVSKYDDEQKKIEEEKKKAEEEAKQRLEDERKKAASATPSAPPAAPASGGGAFDGAYGGTLAVSGQVAQGGPMLAANLRVAGDRLTGTLAHPNCGSLDISLAVAPSGEVSGRTQLADRTCSRVEVSANGRLSGNTLQLNLSSPAVRASGSLTKGVAAAAPGAAPPPSTPAAAAPAPSDNTAFDGTYTGSVTFTRDLQSLSVQVVNGVGTGTWKSPKCGPVTFTVRFQPNGVVGLQLNGYDGTCKRNSNFFSTKIENNRFKVGFTAGDGPAEIVLTRR